MTGVEHPRPTTDPPVRATRKLVSYGDRQRPDTALREASGRGDALTSHCGAWPFADRAARPGVTVPAPPVCSTLNVAGL